MVITSTIAQMRVARTHMAVTKRVSLITNHR